MLKEIHDAFEASITDKEKTHFDHLVLILVNLANNLIRDNVSQLNAMIS